MNVSSELADYLFRIQSLSEEDSQQIRKLLIDFFASAYAGFKQNKEFNANVARVIFSQGGSEESTVLFSAQKVPARTAAFLNSLYGHGAELDDGNRKAMGHVGVHVIPAVLALAEAENKTQDEIMLAIAVGYETYIRISSSVQPGLVNRSFHSTGMAGGIACASACAKLLGLSAEQIESAMSLASTMSSGLLTYSESRQMTKPLNPAKAAETGVFAARLAQSGVKGPLNFLEGPHGWFRAVTDEANEELITVKSEHLLIHECYFKLYPSCRHTHCGIEAAIHIREKIDSRKIQKVNVHIYPNAIKLAGQIKYPADADETKFSIHYTLAIAFLYGEYGVDYMNPPKMTSEVREMIEKIELIPDMDMENRDKGIRGTRINVVLADGSAACATVLIPKGDPEKPLGLDDLVAKFRVCSKNILSDSKADQVIDYFSKFGGKKTLNPNLLFASE